MIPIDELPTVAEGFAKMGVFVSPSASARNCNMNRSVIAKLRNRPAFRLNKPGPRRMSRPEFPNVGVVTAAKAAMLKYGLPGPYPPRICTVGSTWLAVCELPGEFNDVPEALTLNGVPLSRLRIQFNCQPPASAAPGP